MALVRWCQDRDAEACFSCRTAFGTSEGIIVVPVAGCLRLVLALAEKIPELGYTEALRVCGWCYADDEIGEPASMTRRRPWPP